jgi:hypothetical protein
LLTFPNLTQTESRNTNAGAKLKTMPNRRGGGPPAQQFNVRVGKEKTFPLTLGFTKSNELFVGRVAMLGFASAVLGEIVTGKGWDFSVSCSNHKFSDT